MSQKMDFQVALIIILSIKRGDRLEGKKKSTILFRKIAFTIIKLILNKSGIRLL